MPAMSDSISLDAFCSPQAYPRARLGTTISPLRHLAWSVLSARSAGKTSMS